MSWFSNDSVCPIGIDMADDTIKLVQLKKMGKAVKIIYASNVDRPSYIEPATGDWQRWAIDAIKQIVAKGSFKGKDVVAALPASELYVDTMKLPKTEQRDPQEVLMSKLKHKLPFDADDAMIKFLPTEEDNVLVIASERKKIDRYLAIYEKANLRIKTISIWPDALANSYTSFFGRRQSDIDAVVLLIDIEANNTNVIIARHKKILLVRSIPIGMRQFDNESAFSRLIFELNAFKKYFASIYRKPQIERLVFLSGQTVDKNTYTEIAKQLKLSAQLGDCLAAVQFSGPDSGGIERRNCHFSWAAAFGLSLT